MVTHIATVMDVVIGIYGMHYMWTGKEDNVLPHYMDSCPATDCYAIIFQRSAVNAMKLFLGKLQ